MHECIMRIAWPHSAVASRARAHSGRTVGGGEVERGGHGGQPASACSAVSNCLPHFLADDGCHRKLIWDDDDNDDLAPHRSDGRRECVPKTKSQRGNKNKSLVVLWSFHCWKTSCSDVKSRVVLGFSIVITYYLLNLFLHSSLSRFYLRRSQAGQWVMFGLLLLLLLGRLSE